MPTCGSSVFFYPDAFGDRPDPFKPHPIGPPMDPQLLAESAGAFKAWLPGYAFGVAPQGIHSEFLTFYTARWLRSRGFPLGGRSDLKMSRDVPTHLGCILPWEIGRLPKPGCVILSHGSAPWFLYLLAD